jgi:hypothetical protein
MPPYYFPESRDSYIHTIENIANAQIEAGAVLTNAEPSHRKAFVRSILDKAGDYCDKVTEYWQRETGATFVQCRSNARRDLEWTVLFQIVKKSFSDIAADYDVEVSTVTRAVHGFLAWIGLPERPDSGPGRPPGCKDAPDSDRQRERRRR